MTGLLDRLVFLGLLAVIVLTAIPYGTVDPWWEAVFECLVFGLVCLWILQGLLEGNWRLNKLFLIIPMILICVYAFIQTIPFPSGWLDHGGGPVPQNTLTIDRYQTYLTAVKALALTSFLALLLIYTSSMRRLRWLIHVVIGLGLASALFGILRQMLQSPTASEGFLLTFLFPGIGYGQFIAANAFSYLMEMSFALVAGLVLGGGVPRIRILAYIAMGLVMWAALVASNSRGGIVAVACQLVFLLFAAPTQFSRRRAAPSEADRSSVITSIGKSIAFRVAAVAMVVVIVLVVALWMGGQRLSSKLEQQTFSESSINGNTRKEIWNSTWQLIKQHPWRGVGLGTYFLAIPQYHLGAGKVKLEQAHNDYLELLACGGIPAGILAAWFIVMVLLRARASLSSVDTFRFAAGLGALAGILGIGVHSFVDFGLQLTSIAVVFGALITILVVKVSASEFESPGERVLKERRVVSGRGDLGAA